MTKQPYTIVIPARYASSRFPGKPLHPINGRPMILHTVDRARESHADEVYVATDDDRIADVCKKEGVDVVMTREDHPSGTDRIAEVANLKQWTDQRLIVGLQGDEPATPASHLDLLAKSLHETQNADMATLCMRIQRSEDYFNRNRVKVVTDKHGMALYFSRAPIPARRSPASTLNGEDFPDSFLHIGIYAYRCAFLKQYHQVSACRLEQEEQLEQLRVLYNGGCIKVTEVETGLSRGVDHPEDVPILESLLAH